MWSSPDVLGLSQVSARADSADSLLERIVSATDESWKRLSRDRSSFSPDLPSCTVFVRMNPVAIFDYASLRKQERELDQRLTQLKAEGLRLDMSRGKPAPEQLDLSLGLLTALDAADYRSLAGLDCRNYGLLEGIPEARTLLAGLLDLQADNVIVSGNSSLELMHDSVARALSHGVPGGDAPWGKGATKFLCPVPGYDRHFAICDHLGIAMIPVQMDARGPDMDAVEPLVVSDPAVKGIWLVPKYSNPTGITLDDGVVDRLARMPTAARDFRIMWDNAYAVHDLGDGSDKLKSIFAACQAAGTPDRALLFGSTSKISFAGAGLSVMGGSDRNLTWMVQHMSKRTIGPDKLNQLRHVRFFKDFDGIRVHMRAHAKILAPKFDAVQQVLESELGGLGVATWTKPRGGYFVSVDTLDRCAKEIVSAAASAGVKLTEAGATFPLGKDARDRNIRIAPSFPTLPEITKAMEVFSVCVKLASIRCSPSS
jgi:DNA-binding transcriptional MocR family regulator